MPRRSRPPLPSRLATLLGRHPGAVLRQGRVDPSPSAGGATLRAVGVALAAVGLLSIAACGDGGTAQAEGSAPGSEQENPAPAEDDGSGARGGDVEAPDRATEGEVVLLSSAEAAALREELPDMLFVDVRTQDEYIAGHMVGAQNISFEDPGLWERRTEPLDRDRPTVVYCRTGNRSAQAAQDLVERGFTEVYDLGGIGDWGEGDLPVDR